MIRQSGASGLVAITGGTGFLGPYLVQALRQDGWRVRLLTRKAAMPPYTHETVRGSLCDASALDALIDGADALIHAAGLIKAVRPQEFYSVNAEGSRRVAAAIDRCRRPLRTVIVSSLAARAPHLSDYANSKRMGEAAFDAVADRVVVRPTAVYGPGDRETAVFFRAALRSPLFPVPRAPQARVTMIHAADVAAAVAALCRPPGPQRAVFELTDVCPQGYAWRELAKEILTATESRARIVELPAAAFRAIARCSALWGRMTGRAAMLGPGKVRELLYDWSSNSSDQPSPGIWRPRILLHEGLRETVRWLTEQSITIR